MPWISVNNIAYHYLRSGAGQPLVLLHGFTGSSLSWNGLAQVLSSQRDVVAIDLPGHGQTESPQSPARYSIDQTAKDIVAIASQLGLDRFSLLGYSMGGRLALYLAHRYPNSIKALILESASPGIAETAERKQRQQWDFALADSIEREGIREFVNHWEQLPLFASQSAVSEHRRAKLRAQRLHNNPVGLANSLRGMGTGSQPTLWDALPAVTIPSLLLCGELDEKYIHINQQMAGAMPNCELETLQDAGHNIHFERPDEFSTVVVSFLQRNSQSIS